MQSALLGVEGEGEVYRWVTKCCLESWGPADGEGEDSAAVSAVS